MPDRASRPTVRTSRFRSTVEHRSDGLARRLSGLPAATPLVIALILTAVGVLVRCIVGACCFGVLTLFLGWLLFMTWPRLTPLERLMRGSLLLLTAVLTLVLALPR